MLDAVSDVAADDDEAAVDALASPRSNMTSSKSLFVSCLARVFNRRLRRCAFCAAWLPTFRLSRAAFCSSFNYRICCCKLPIVREQA